MISQNSITCSGSTLIFSILKWSFWRAHGPFRHLCSVWSGLRTLVLFIWLARLDWVLKQGEFHDGRLRSQDNLKCFRKDYFRKLKQKVELKSRGRSEARAFSLAQAKAGVSPLGDNTGQWACSRSSDCLYQQLLLFLGCSLLCKPYACTRCVADGISWVFTTL